MMILPNEKVQEAASALIQAISDQGGKTEGKAVVGVVIGKEGVSFFSYFKHGENAPLSFMETMAVLNVFSEGFSKVVGSK